MVGQSLLLLADVQLLYIVDELLLQPIPVIFRSRYLLQPLLYAGPDALHPTLLQRLDVCQKMLNVVYFLCKLALKRTSLLLAEVNKTVKSLSHTSLHHNPFLILQDLHIRLRQHIRHTGQRVNPVLRLRYARTAGNGFQLLVVILHKGGVHRSSLHTAFPFRPYTHVYLTPDKGLGHHLTYLHLLLSIERCYACLQVKLLAVERFDFYVNFLLFIGYNSAAVARH